MTLAMKKPRVWDADFVLMDGTTVHIRAIGPDDHARLQRFHASLSPETIYFRFFSGHTTLSSQELHAFCKVDFADRMAFVAVDSDGEFVAVGRYDRTEGSDEAEVAFTVTDAYQERGLATILLDHLAAYAITKGIRRFAAETLAENRKMREVLRHAGFAEHEEFDGVGIHVEMNIEPTRESLAAVEERVPTAAVHSDAEAAYLQRDLASRLGRTSRHTA